MYAVTFHYALLHILPSPEIYVAFKYTKREVNKNYILT